MRCAAFFAVGLLLGAAAPVLAQGGSRDDGPPPRNFSEPRFDPRYGPPPGADAPFSPRHDFRPPLFDRPPPREARPRESTRRVPAPQPRPKSRSHRAVPREVARHASPRHAAPRRASPHAPPPRDYGRRDERDRGPPPPHRYDERRREPNGRQAYRDEPRYDPRREPRHDRRPPRRDDRERHGYDRHPASRLNSEQEYRRALLQEYERIVRRQMEIERELGGDLPPRPPRNRDRYSEAGRYRR